MGEGINAFSSYLPVEINGWKKTEKDVIYTPKNLFKYINGGAELYISYGFKKVLTCKYKKENGPDITLDIFDMGTPSNAFGVFTHGFETTNEDMGQGSEYSDGLLTFWKGKYYVSILSFPETKELKKTILKLGRTIDGFIKKKGPLPQIVSMLPSDGLISSSIRYFRHHIWLNSHHFISNENILYLDEKTEAVLAKYKIGKNSHLVLLVLYPDIKKANKAYDSFIKNYFPVATEGIKKMDNGSWAGCKQINHSIIAVFNVSHSEMIKKIFLNQKIPGGKHE